MEPASQQEAGVSALYPTTEVGSGTVVPYRCTCPHVDGLSSPHLSRDEHMAQTKPECSAGGSVLSSPPSPRPEAAERSSEPGRRRAPGVCGCVRSRTPFRAFSYTFLECLQDSLKELRVTCNLKSLSNKISKQTEEKFQPAMTHHKNHPLFPKATSAGEHHFTLKQKVKG